MTFNCADPSLACIQKALLAHMWPQTSCPAQEKIAPRNRACMGIFARDDEEAAYQKSPRVMYVRMFASSYDI